MLKSDVLVGLQFGDCGKGKCVKTILESYDYSYCVRYNGGPNAGHTIYVDGKKVVTHCIPTGVVVGVPSVIGPNCVISEEGFWDELLELKEALPQYDVTSLVKISPYTHIILPEHVEEDKRDDKIGSTKRGIAPTYAAKMLRKGVRAEDIPSLKPFLFDT